MEIIKEVLKLKHKSESLPPLSSEQERKLREKADIDHVYYSSVLEGRKITRKEVEKIANAS